MGSIFGDGGAGAAAKNATRTLQRLELPDIKLMELELQDLVSQGQISPEQAQAQLQEQSLLNGIAVDPRLKNAQMDALSGLQERVDNEGLTAQDRANIERTKGELAGQQRGQRESILQNARQRGVGGSGLELLAQLQAQQGSAQEASQQGFDLAALQQNQKLAALEQLGQLGGQMRGQEFGEQAQIAAAQDAINQFNTQNRQQTNMANVGARNQAQQFNLGEKQRIADSNVGTRNQQQQYNKQLIQQDFDNKYKKAGGVANAYQNQAGVAAQSQANQNALIGNAISAGAMAYGKPPTK